jgi:broad specificity phosphatase PhoE
MWKMKQILAEYSKKYKKIAIVSHYHIVQCLLSEKFDAKGNVIDSRWISNA